MQDSYILLSRNIGKELPLHAA